MVTFACDGPNLSAEVEVFVDSVAEEAAAIAFDVSPRHDTLATSARATSGRRIEDGMREGDQGA